MFLLGNGSFHTSRVFSVAPVPVLFFLLLAVRTPHVEYYALCLFCGVCVATSKFWRLLQNLEVTIKIGEKSSTHVFVPFGGKY